MSYEPFKKLFDAMRADQELMDARAEYTRLTGKHPPGINHDTFRGWDDYKEKLLKELKKLRKEENT